jgi:hypothetical protein
MKKTKTYFEIYPFYLLRKLSKGNGLVDSIQEMDKDNSYASDRKAIRWQKLPTKQQGSFDNVFKRNIQKHSTLSFAKK